MGRIFLANVGANSSHSFTSPIFEDGTFEFLPIPENPLIEGQHVVQYRTIKPYNIHISNLLQFVPMKLWGTPAHNDPEFETFTYGDNCSTNPRASGLKALNPGDNLFFLTNLRSWKDGEATSTHGFYLIGFLEVEEVLREVISRPSTQILKRFGKNAHVRRGLSNRKLWDLFWVFKGSDRSRRFNKAIPITREISSKIFVDAQGYPWQWDQLRTDLQVIGSYTRSCRCIIDTQLNDHRLRAETFQNWIRSHDV